MGEMAMNEYVVICPWVEHGAGKIFAGDFIWLYPSEADAFVKRGWLRLKKEGEISAVGTIVTVDVPMEEPFKFPFVTPSGEKQGGSDADHIST